MTVAAESVRVADLWPAARVVGDQLAIRGVFMRGGTSRGAFLRAEDLPPDPAARDRAILAMYGSPDSRQIDGLGGAEPLTSKVAIVGPATRPGADVDYLFGQVRISEPIVDYRGNCGNMLAGIGPFAVDEGLVQATEPVTRVRIHQVNTHTLVMAEVPTRSGRALTAGAATTPGVPGTGAAIKLDFAASANTLGRGLLPTGHATEQLEDGAGRAYRVSLVDAGNPTVFLSAADLGLEAQALVASSYPAELMERLEQIRGAAAERLGFVADRRRSAAESPTVPKIYLVHPPAGYVTQLGLRVRGDDIDLVARGLVTQRLHAAYAATVAIATATATRLPGTIPADVATRRAPNVVRIGHPGGVIALEVAVELDEPGGPRLARAVIERTARRVMSGDVYVPMRVLFAG
ncbi:MAG TPA: PrpF domain-containing protein [Candidatus Limnocylindria bacterium]|nr:PrpF domain-containing protein [Candidatus Limnocylindria bacterium]